MLVETCNCNPFQGNFLKSSARRLDLKSLEFEHFVVCYYVRVYYKQSN